MVNNNSDNTKFIERNGMITELPDDTVCTNNDTIVNDDNCCSPDYDDLQKKIIQPDWSSLEKSFTDLNVIGMGGMATVFSAKDSLFYRNVALKVMKQDLRKTDRNVDSFIREARITAQIDHPNIIPVYNMGVFKEMGPYFSMKKVGGTTLGNILHKLEDGDSAAEKKYTLRRRLEIFISICNGVAFAHSKGVIHCDLKPGNIMLGDYGEVFIMDWGMALYRPQDDSSENNRKIDLREQLEHQKKKQKIEFSKTVHGTPAFMAPEQIFGQTDAIDRQTDVYALGVILYALLTCTQSPFSSKIPAEEIFELALAGKFLPPRKRAPKRKISNELEVVCLKAMSPYKHERYNSVRELMQDIRNILEMRPIEVYQFPFINFFKYCARHPMIPTALVGALLTLGVFYSYFVFNDILQARTVYQVLSINMDEVSPMSVKLSKEIRYLKNENKGNGEKILFSENNLDTETHNIKNKLGYNANQILNTLIQLNSLTSNKKYEPIVTQAVNFCFAYFISTGNSENIKKLQNLPPGIVAKVYEKLITSNPVLRRNLQMFAANYGNIDFKTEDKSLQIKIKKNLQNDTENNLHKIASSLFEYNASGNFNINLKSGEYSIFITDENNTQIVIPLFIKAGDHRTINFKMPEKFPSDCVYIHEGEYYSNISNYFSDGDIIHTDSYFILDHEVTIGEYLEFFKTIKDEKLKQQYNPDLLFFNNNKLALFKLFGKNYEILPPHNINMPLVGVSAEAAQAYCDYIAKKLGMKCRLPYFEEIEKAARGTGRRLYVWGDKFNPEYALLAINPQIDKYPLSAPPKTFEKDCSPYGAFDLCGNVRELIQLRNSREKFAIFGGSYKNTSAYAKINTLTRYLENRTDVGMRYVIEIPKKK